MCDAAGCSEFAVTVKGLVLASHSSSAAPLDLAAVRAAAAAAALADWRPPPQPLMAPAAVADAPQRNLAPLHEAL